MTTPSTPATENLAKRGRIWAYTGVIVGGLISVTANVAHSFVAPAGAPADWAPKPGAIGFAMAWPILLFIALEVLARVAWLPGWRWTLLRLGGLLPIVAITGIVSWRHQSGLLAYYGEDDLVSFLGPLAVDGLMVMSTTALLVIGIRKAQQLAITSSAAEPATPVAPQPTHNYAPSLPATTQCDLIPVTTPAAPGTVTAVKQTPGHLVSAARSVVASHKNRYGQPMTAAQLAQVMSVPAETADEILAALTPAPVLNGHITGGAA